MVEDSIDQYCSQFLAFTGSEDPNVARQYLEMSGTDLQLAVSLFLDHSAANTAAAASIAADADDQEMPNNEVLDDQSSSSEPDYDYLVEERSLSQNNNEQNNNITEQNNEFDDSRSCDESIPSTPDYDNLGADCEDQEEVQFQQYQHQEQNDINVAHTVSTFPVIPSANEFDNIGSNDHHEDGQHIDIDYEAIGEDYILGTLMVRVLQARNLRPNPNNQGGIGTLLSNHRRARHQRATMSPASGGGNITPLSSSLNPYAKLSFRDGDTQLTSTAFDHGHGNYHWSRGDQSYFDVTCSSFPLRMGKFHQSKSQQSFKSKSSSQQSSSPKKEPIPKKVASWNKMNDQSHHKRPSPPMLQFSLFSKSSTSGKNKKQFGSEEDYMVGKCSINVLRILTGKTPYFDEWCTLNKDNNEAGRVRVVIEYEPSDPPPRPGDICVFANVYPVINEELYPVPLFTVKNVPRPMRSSLSMTSCTTISSTSLSSSVFSRSAPLALYPKTFRVDEVVGDHVVLCYKTPEGWNCTFEVHRYLLLCIERYQAVVEKCKDQVLDLCDNLTQSPMVDIIGKKIEAVPDEGLVFVGTEAVGGSINMLGRWLANGVDYAVNDVVDGFNLDGRYSHLSDEEEEEASEKDYDDQYNTSIPNQNIDVKEKQALPGMPDCPITGAPMVDPVVAADGHTYERSAITRWMQTSDKSPLTGEVLSHSKLVSNYMLIGLSSISKTG